MLTPLQQKILNAEICPYCSSGTKVISEKDVYGKIYKNRPIYACERFPACDSYVGSWEDHTPMGRLANLQLRKYRNYAHKNFDKLFKDGIMTRDEAYENLSIYLKTPPEVTHIAMFQEHTLRLVVGWSFRMRAKYIVEKAKDEMLIRVRNNFISKRILV